MSATLHIQLLGDCHLAYGEQTLRRLDSPRLQALLVYLLLHRGAPQPRQRIAFLLYPDSTEAQARTNLRKLIHFLREALPDAQRFLNIETQTLQWRADAAFTLDVLAFEQAAAHRDSIAHLRDAVDLYRGDLLPGHYDDWLLSERERLRQLFVETLQALIQRLEDERAYATAIQYTQQLLRHDSLHEETYRQLMRLHASRGDLTGMVRVYQTCVAVLKQELGVEVGPGTRELYERLRALKISAAATPLPTPRTQRDNLPIQLTRFLGREAAIATLKERLHPVNSSLPARLLTLTGAGGSGKTRLALEMAAELVESFQDGAWLVDLAALSDPMLVLQAVATTLDVREQPGVSLLQTLVDYLQAKTMLLVLDNCEHLLDACARLAETLLQRCPRLQILATSRERLNIVGEQVWLVPTLSLPTPEQEANLAELQRSEAVRLFIERATATLPTFHLSINNASAVARLCRRLDGLPLAIELAAARAKALRVEQLVERLDDRFRLLTGGSRTALPRQQTLRGMLDCSYSLLSEPERIVFRRLSVFAGGWTLEAAEQVVGDGEVGLGKDGRSALDVLDVLARLVDKSLVVNEASAEQTPRYHYLETIRQYAREKLRDSGEQAQVRDRHLVFLLQVAEEAYPKLQGPEQFTWMDRLASEHDNVHAAIEWSLQGGRVDAGLCITGNLFVYWFVRSHWTEARQALEALLARPEGMRKTAVRARALGTLGWFHAVFGEVELAHTNLAEAIAMARECGATTILGELLTLMAYFAIRQSADTAYRFAQEGLALGRELHDSFIMGHALNNLGTIESVRGNFGAARQFFEECIAVGTRSGDTWVVSGALLNLGPVLIAQGEYTRARTCIMDALNIQRQIGDKYDIAFSMRNLGKLAFEQHDLVAAQAYYEESLAIGRDIGYRDGIAMSLRNLGDLAIAQGDYVAARAHYCESLMSWHETGSQERVMYCLGGLAAAMAGMGDLPRAAQLSAAAETLRSTLNYAWDADRQHIYDTTVTAARAGLSQAEFGAAWDAGAAMSIEHVIASAITSTTI